MALQVNQAPDPRWTVNKAAIAQFFGLSLPAVDHMIRTGCPALEIGSQGKAWAFDLRAVVAWRCRTPAGEPGADAAPDPKIERALLDKARREEIELRIAEKARHLIPARQYETALSDALKTVAMTLESLPDLLERDAGLTGAAVDKAIEVIDKLRESLYQAIVSGATHG